MGKFNRTVKIEPEPESKVLLATIILEDDSSFFSFGVTRKEAEDLYMTLVTFMTEHRGIKEGEINLTPLDEHLMKMEKTAKVRKKRK